MKWILIIIGVLLFGALIYFLMKKKPIATGVDVSGVPLSWMQPCTTPPYNNSQWVCQQSWINAQQHGISTYSGWASYLCSQGHC